MSTLNVTRGTHHIDNANDTARKFKISASISLNDKLEVVAVVSGQVYSTDETESKQLCSFDRNRDGDFTYNFYKASLEEQKELVDAVGQFVNKAKGAKVTVSFGE